MFWSGNRERVVAPKQPLRILNIPVVLTSSQEQNLQGYFLPELQQILLDANAVRVKRTVIVNA